ncbi:putative reverse transcriptase domain-containing protein [Tanacetum coccineum]
MIVRFVIILERRNVVADALSRKDRVKPLRVRALMMTIDLNLSSQILNAQAEAMKGENINGENLIRMNKKFKTRDDGTHCIENRKIADLLLISGNHSKSLRYSGRYDSMSTAYHPQTDGQSERTIQTLEDMLRACGIDFGKGWD